MSAPDQTKFVKRFTCHDNLIPVLMLSVNMAEYKEIILPIELI